MAIVSEAFVHKPKTMMNTIQIFENSEFGQVRTMTNAEGEPLFCGKDVCDALGYSNGRDAVRKHVDGEDKTTVAICNTGSWQRISTLVQEEDAGNLVNGWTLALPLGNGACHSILALAGEVGCNAETSLRAARAENIFKHLQITVGSLNEELGLMLGIGARLEMLEHLGTLATIDG